MGVNLGELIKPLKKEINLNYLNNKVIAIDGFNTLYQFLSTIRQIDGTPLMNSEGKITSHLSGLFYRTINLIEKGIKPVYVFDGEAPPFKRKEREKREKNKEKYKEKLEKAKEIGEKNLKKYAQATAFLTTEMIEESKELLKAMGIPVIQAPSEGEAQAAYLNKKGKVDLVGSQDYDSLIFGANTLVRNLNLVGKRKVANKEIYEEIKPEILERNKILSELKINEDQLIALALLVGTDYNPSGIKGIGPKKALEIIKKFGNNFELLFKYIKWENYFDVDWRELFEFFKQPPTIECEIKFNKIEEDKIIEILIEKNEFSKERVLRYIEILKKSNYNKQKTVLDFFNR